MNLKLLEDLNCSQYIIEHSNAVLNKAQDIAANFEIDEDVVGAGALMHDVGRLKTQGIWHGIEGGRILKENGFPLEIVRIAEVHIGAGITQAEAVKMGLPPQDYLPLSLEEKIVTHADNLIHGIKEVNLQFVVSKWEKSMGKDHPSLLRLRKLHRELLG
ncbi:MAG: TIGR00295 family protein [Methanobacterium sp.]|nr:TIGR00295 family protein [Methanobacterium sp.]